MIDKLDGNNNKSYDEYITTKKNGKDYHFICPRFWCIRDPKTGKGRSLSIEQVNDGECGGWNAVIPANAKKIPEGKNIYEFTDQLKHRDNVKDSNNKLIYRPHYPSFMKKDTHPDGLCIPCCYTKPNTWGDNYKKIDDKYININDPSKSFTWNEMMQKKIPLNNFSLQIPDNREGKYFKKVPTMNDFKKVKHIFKNGKLNKMDLNINKFPEEFHRYRSSPRKNNNRYLQCHKNTINSNIKINNTKKNIKNLHTKPLLDTFPLPEHKFGYLNIAMQKFLNFNNESKCYIRRNDDNLKTGNKCLLRYGVNGNINNSFLSCIGHIMKYKEKMIVNDNNYNNNIVDVNNVIKHIIKHLTLDKFLSCNKGNLYHSFFNPKILFKDDAKKYSKTLTINEKKLKNIIGITAYEKVFSAREQFFNYLSDDNSIINHVFLWDLICSPLNEHGLFFKNGVNLIIFNTPNNDITQKIEILCPTYNITNNIFDSNKNTIMIYCENDIYEPIYIVEKKTKAHNIWKIFNHRFLKNEKTLEEIYKFMIIIKNNIYLCNEQPSNKNYMENWQSNINFNELIEQLSKNKKIKQIINHYYQTIGILYNYDKENNLYIPCKPSNINFNYDFEYIGDKFYGLDYDITINKLKELNIIINKKDNIILKPKHIIVQDELVVAIVTNTNQTILVNPTKYIPNKFKDYEIIREEWAQKANEYNYLDHKIKINIDKGIDKHRINEIKKIKLENNFYNIYRNIFRININKKIYENEKHNIIYITENNITNDNKIMDYNTKMKKIKKYIEKIIKKNIDFITFDKNIPINDLVLCLDLNKNNCSKPFCSFNENNTCKQLLPKKNYIDSKLLNEELYLHRLADELIRYQKIKSYIFTNNIYLSFDNIEYNINKNEIIILEDILKEEFDKNIKVVPENLYLYNKKLFDNTNPETTNIIPINTLYQNKLIARPYNDLDIKNTPNDENNIVELAERNADMVYEMSKKIVKKIEQTVEKKVEKKAEKKVEKKAEKKVENKAKKKKKINQKEQRKYCHNSFFKILLHNLKTNKKLIVKSIKEMVDFCNKHIHGKESDDDKFKGIYDMWGSGDPANAARKKFDKLIYSKFWSGQKIKHINENTIKDKISKLNIPGISNNNIFIEYIANSKINDCTKKEGVIRFTIIPYLTNFGKGELEINENNIIPNASGNIFKTSSQMYKNWNEFYNNNK